MHQKPKKLAFYLDAGTPLNIYPTAIKKEGEASTIMLYDDRHVLAHKEILKDGRYRLTINDCGLRTRAVFFRLNAVLARFYLDLIIWTKDGWYWQGKPFPLNTPLTFMEETHKTAPNFKN